MEGKVVVEIVDKDKKEGGNEWCTGEQHGIHDDADDDIEPEHRVVVVGRRLLEVGQSLREAAGLQVAGHQGEDRQDAHYAVIVGCQQAEQKHTDDQIQQLGHTAVHGPPKEAPCRFFL